MCYRWLFNSNRQQVIDPIPVEHNRDVYRANFDVQLRLLDKQLVLWKKGHCLRRKKY